jgi:hypothetical protein
VGDTAALAVVPVTVLLTGDQNPLPILMALNVPVYAPLEAARDGQVARGHFAIDLFAHLPNLPIQSYAVWAFSRRVISEPALLGVVSEAMLPVAGD